MGSDFPGGTPTLLITTHKTMCHVPLFPHLQDGDYHKQYLFHLISFMRNKSDNPCEEKLVPHTRSTILVAIINSKNICRASSMCLVLSALCLPSWSLF